MNRDPNNVETRLPDDRIEGEEMKMPENASAQSSSSQNPAVPGMVIVVLGVLLLAILVGLFMWFTNMQNNESNPAPAQVERPTPEENNEPESTTAEAQTDNLETTSTSDEISAIEADVEATDLESLDAELEAIEAELNAAI